MLKSCRVLKRSLPLLLIFFLAPNFFWIQPLTWAASISTSSQSIPTLNSQTELKEIPQVAVDNDTEISPVPQIQASELQENNENNSFMNRLQRNVGLSYLSFFYGPGIHHANRLYNPNNFGNPQQDGMYFLNNLSFRFKFSTHLALDVQTRFKAFINNFSGKKEEFRHLRWEAPRVGVSGVLLSGEEWTLSGAVNTDFPYFMPYPLTGHQAQQRTVILTPGMFANFMYRPKGSRWSIFSVITPRLFIYEDRNKTENAHLTAGYIKGNKPELILAFLPTLSYRITEKLSLSVGSSIEYRKLVISDWNPLKASIVPNGPSKAWRLDALPVSAGVTVEFSKSFILFPYITTYPIAAQRFDAKSNKQASLLHSTSVGMWLRGTIF